LGEVEPLKQNAPLLQTKQLSDASYGWYVPAAQLEHDAAFALAA
jgi:hypothetical protein